MTFISGEAKIGENCTLHGQACLATDLSGTKAPVLGNNVDVGYGAIVIGDVYIADDVRIGAGAVVTKSCYEKGATLVGVPAKVIKTKE
jgi:serine O-acetyltransferase